MIHPKPQEIRTGNYFKILTGTYVEITSVDRVGLIEYMEFGNPIEEYEDSTTALFPIELTEEWFLKSGFTQFGDNMEYFEHEEFPQLSFLNQGASFKVFDFGDVVLTYVKYVHQLQNLYCILTGQELTIKE